MKKLLFTLLLAIGVMVSASAQKVDINAVVNDTAEQVVKDKNLSADKKEIIVTILQDKLKEMRELNAKKPSQEERQAAVKKINGKYNALITEKVGPSLSGYVNNTFNKKRTAAAEAAKKQ